MNRFKDLLVSFNLALLVHGLLVLGAVWLWHARRAQLEPLFLEGEISLAVTFVAEAKEREALSVEPQASTKPVEPETRREEWEADERDAWHGDWEAPELEAWRGELDLETEKPAQERAVLGAERRKTDTGRQTPDDEPEERGAEAAERDAAFAQGVSGALRMQSEIRPYYPLGARMRGEEGVVTVRVWVSKSGNALRCEVARSSGFPVLDAAAVDAARRARYVSTRPGAWRAEAETTLTFRFKLTE